MSKKRSYSIYSEANVEDYLLMQTSEQENKISTIVEVLKTEYPYLYTIDDKNEVPFKRATNPDRQKALDLYQNNIIVQNGIKKNKDNIDQTGWIWITETKDIVPAQINLTNKPSIDEKLLNCDVDYTLKFNGDYLNQVSVIVNPTKNYYNVDDRTIPKNPNAKHFTETSWVRENQVTMKDTQVTGKTFDVGRTPMKDKDFYKLFYKMVAQVGSKLGTENKIEYFKDLVLNSVQFVNQKTIGNKGIDKVCDRGVTETDAKTLNYMIVKNVKIACYAGIGGSQPDALQFQNPLTYLDKFGNTIHEFVIPEVAIPFQIAGSQWLPYTLRTYITYPGQVFEVSTEAGLLTALQNCINGDTIMLVNTINLMNPIIIGKQICLTAASKSFALTHAGTEATTVTVTSDTVVIKNITIQSGGTGSTASAIAFTLTSAQNCYVDNCEIHTNEFGIVVNCDRIQITNCVFNWTGTPDSNRYIYIQRCTGETFIDNNIFKGNRDYLDPSNTPSTQCITIGNTTAANLTNGKLYISNNNNNGFNPVQRLFHTDIVLTNSNMEFYFINNEMKCYSGFAIFYASTVLQGIKHIVATGNTETLSSGATGSKGIIGLDTASTGVIMDIQIYAANNKIPALRSDYTSLCTTTYTGTVTSATGTTLVDTTRTWSNNFWRDSVFGVGVVEILSGTGAGQTRTVGGNSSNTLFVSSKWTDTPDNTSQYKVSFSSNAVAYATAKFSPYFVENTRESIALLNNKPFYWNPLFIMNNFEMSKIDPADNLPYNTTDMKFMLNPPLAGFDPLTGFSKDPSLFYDQVAFNATNVLGITPKMYYEETTTKPSIILVQNVSHTLDSYLVTPFIIGNQIELSKDLVRCFINQNHLPLQILKQLSYYSSGGNYYWRMPYFDILEFSFDNEYEHDVRDRALPPKVLTPGSTITVKSLTDYVPARSSAEFFCPNLTMTTELRVNATYQYFRPKAGYVARTHTSLRSEDLDAKFTQVENALIELKSDVKTAQSDISQLALFSNQLYDAVVTNYDQLFNVVKNYNNAKDRDTLDQYSSYAKTGKGVFVKAFGLIPVVGQYANYVDGALDLIISTATEVGKSQIVDSVLNIKDAALAMASIDTQLIGNILRRNYVIEEDDKKKLARNSIAYLEEMQYKFRLVQEFDEKYSTFVDNHCTYYLRKISQFKALGNVAWKYARLNYTNSDMQKSNLVPGHAFLEIVLTKVGKVNNQYTMIQYIYIVSTGDFNSLGFNVALLTLLRESQRRSLFNYKVFTKEFNFTDRKFVWTSEQMQKDYAEFWQGLREEQINNPEEDQHYAVLNTEVNVQPDALNFFLEAYKVNAPAYNILGFNCQVQAKEVMNFIVQGLIPSWWTDEQNLNLAVSLVNSPSRSQYFDQSFKNAIANPQGKPSDPGTNT